MEVHYTNLSTYIHLKFSIKVLKQDIKWLLGRSLIYIYILWEKYIYIFGRYIYIYGRNGKRPVLIYKKGDA